MSFQKATKTQSKLRCALFGVSGSGKTYSALSIAKGLGTKIALIDTERGSASKYSDRFNFDVCELQVRTIDSYISAIHDAESGGYDVLIIDSMTHAWEELLTDIDKLAATKYKGNSFRAWSEGTPKQRKFVDAILNFNGHILATMRSKTEWSVENKDGRMTPQRVGLTPEQGKGIEYEFDLLLEMSGEHYCTVLKDRTSKYQDQIIEKPGEKFGKELKDWLNDEALPEKKKETKPEVPAPNPYSEEAIKQAKQWIAEGLITASNFNAQVDLVAKRKNAKLSQLSNSDIDKVMKPLKKITDANTKKDPIAGTGFDETPVDPAGNPDDFHTEGK